MFPREKAFIGDAILALHVRDWALKRYPVERLRNTFCMECCTNKILSKFARHILFEPAWGGTGMEAHLYDVREQFGAEAAQALVERICVYAEEEVEKMKKEAE
jgi:hypothetical protein